MAKKPSFKMTTYKDYDIDKLSNNIKACLDNIKDETDFNSVGNITIMFDLYMDGEKIEDNHIVQVVKK